MLDESGCARETDAALTAASNEMTTRLKALQIKPSLRSRLGLRSARELRDALNEPWLQPLIIQRFFERAWYLGIMNVAIGGAGTKRIAHLVTAL